MIKTKYHLYMPNASYSHSNKHMLPITTLTNISLQRLNLCLQPPRKRFDLLNPIIKARIHLLIIIIGWAWRRCREAILHPCLRLLLRRSRCHRNLRLGNHRLGDVIDTGPRRELLHILPLRALLRGNRAGGTMPSPLAAPKYCVKYIPPTQPPLQRSLLLLRLQDLLWLVLASWYHPVWPCRRALGKTSFRLEGDHGILACRPRGIESFEHLLAPFRGDGVGWPAAKDARRVFGEVSGEDGFCDRD
jgi:hypothetical protein